MIEAVLAFLFGLLIGSFLNVCVYRLPRDLSIVRPRSYCPACEHRIAWSDNIPLVSYVLLKGRCRHCGARIPLRYPAVELLTAVLFAVFVAVLGPTLEALKDCLFTALLVGLLFADFEQRILPDEFTLGGLGAGLVLAWFVPVNDGLISMFLSFIGAQPDPRRLSVVEAVLGASIPAGFLWLAGLLFEQIRQKEGLGFGDVKMVAMMGAFLGLRGTLLTLVAGSLAGSVLGLAWILIRRKEVGSYELPFGTFLGAAAIGVSLLRLLPAWR